MQIMKVGILLVAFLVCVSPLHAGHLTGGTLSSLDSAGSTRSPAVFNNSEKIGFSYSVTNSRTQSGFIQFTFTLTDPSGRTVLTQQGNAVSAEQTGTAGASVVGIPITDFYSSPGSYRLKGEAKFSDNSETVSTNLSVEIYSPILNLTYPPNGSQNLTDQPLTFRWVGTGATKYKVTVADNPSLFNPLLTSEGTEAQFSYPTNPSDTRQRLASGQVYYWTVEGLDTSGTKTSEPSSPYSFTVAGGASQAQSKDLAITGIEESLLLPDSPSKKIVDVTVKNQGGRPESTIVVPVFVQGVSQGKQTIDSINPLEEKKLSFTVDPPVSRSGSGFLVSATLEGFFDDVLFNNSLTKQIAWPRIPEQVPEKIEIPEKKETKKEEKPREKEKKKTEDKFTILKGIIKRMAPATHKELEGYSLKSVEGEGLSDEEVSKILAGLDDGTVKILSLVME